MRIAILSRQPRSYTAGRFKAAARERGHSVRVLNTMKFSIFLEKGSPSLSYDGKELTDIDVIIPRIGASITFFGTAVVRHFEQMGIYTPNSSQAINVSRDKLKSLQVLSRHKIGIPTTAFVRRPEDVLAALEQVGGAPVIIKLLEGTQGIGVILADSVAIAAAIVETLHSKNINVLLQRFVSESKGKDIRAFVVGNKVVAAARRQAKGQEFRSNIHRGGSATAVELDETYRKAAVAAAQIMGLGVAGVDMLEGKDGPQIMEVNSSPGLEGIETATGVDIAGTIIDYIEKQVNFPEIDLRQRLSVHEGYGVAEFNATKATSLPGKTIEESGLRNRDIQVLSIERPGAVIPNPKGNRIIEEGDHLLCFGKLEALRALLPLKKKKRRKKAEGAAPAGEGPRPGEAGRG